MNPLTQVKRIKEINSKEAALGISEDASWHAKYKESPYVYAGGLDFGLTEGDLLAIFSQYGEIVDVNLVRHKDTGKSKGFAFVAYEDQRSTNLAVDNLNGASVSGRIMRVDHVTKYKKKEEEDEEMEQLKREEKGVCYAFQKGECNRGASCKFSHNEQRAANTGWGQKDDKANWQHDRHEVPPIKSGRAAGNFSGRIAESRENFRSDKRLSKADDGEEGRKSYPMRSEMNQNRRGVERTSEKSEKESHHRDWDRQEAEKRSEKYDSESKSKENVDRGRREEKSLRHESERNPREDRDRKEKAGRYDSEPNSKEDRDRNARDERSGRHESEQNRKNDYDRRGGEKRSRYDESARNPREDHDRKEKSGRYDSEPNPREDRDGRRREERSGWHESEQNRNDDFDRRGGDKESRYDGDFSSHDHREEDVVQAKRARR